ncbi:MAG: PrsW family glutamic-type intramembrane protease [Candidatus Hermodarchaeota archaeon]
MSLKNPYKPVNIKLEPNKVRIWILLLVGAAIYAIITLLIITSTTIPSPIKTFTIYSYAIIGPLTFYAIWILFYHWKASKWPQNKDMFGGHYHYLVLFIIMGVCVITWSAYWNTGFDTVWAAIAITFYIFTNNEFGTLIIYTIGATAITPALVEEFNKSFPSILAFFVVLQRSKKSDQKNKGMLGNELNGFLIGILIGLTFEGIETASYLMITILSGGSDLSIYLQVTLRNWGPIHILGGALGGYAAGRAERLRFELKEEYLPMKVQVKKFLKRFIPIWLIPVSMHFLWNSSSVWIYLIFLAVNIQDEFIYLLTVIIFQLGLAVTCFIILLIFYRRANKIAEKTYRCADTGFIIIDQNVVCETVSDINPLKTEEISSNKTTISLNYCPNCRNVLKPTDNFCSNCRYDLRQFKKHPSSLSTQPKLYVSSSIKLFYITIIGAIIFFLVNLGLFLIILSSDVGALWILVLGQLIVELISSMMMIYAAITLLKLRKNYNGKKSVWSWLFLIYNLVGMLVMLIAIGLSFLITIIFSILLNETRGLFLINIITIILFTGALGIFIFLRKVLLKEKQLLQFQRWY